MAKEKSAFGGMTSIVDNGIRAWFIRASDMLVDSFGLTNREYLDHFITDEARPYVEFASGYLTELGSYERRVRIPYRDNAAPTLVVKPRLATPRDIFTALPNRDTDVGRRLDKWVEQQLELCRQFGLVRYTFNNLNKLCRSKEDLRALWPSVLILLQGDPNDEVTSNLRGNLLDYRPSSRAPSLPYELRRACIESGTFITSLALLGNEDHTTQSYQVEFELSDLPDFEFEGISIGRYFLSD